MSYVSGRRLIQMMCEDRIVVPFDIYNVNPASVDLSLGTTFICEALLENGDPTQFTREVPFGCSLKLEPGEWVLACTRERVKIPPGYIGFLVLKSSLARRGIDHAMAGLLDPGYEGTPTLELFNARRLNNVTLYSGERIVQMVLAELDSMDTEFLYNGRYQNATTVEGEKEYKDDYNRPWNPKANSPYLAAGESICSPEQAAKGTTKQTVNTARQDHTEQSVNPSCCKEHESKGTGYCPAYDVPFLI